jgi:thiamine biosynthesis lipoprotein
MNTRFSMVLIGLEATQSEALFQATERQLHQLELLMSRFHPHGPLTELNQTAANQPYTPPDDLWQLLQLCRDYWQQTNGAFDITLRPLQELWRNDTEPTAAAIEQTRQQTGFDKLHFDEAARTIQFTMPGMTLDLGAIGKGYALDQIAQTLRKQGVQQAFLSFGESSITVLGSHPHGPSWPIGIPNQFNPTETLHTFALKDASLSTSGATPANQHQTLTINPKTARPIPNYRTLSVAAPAATEAEVLSTALTVTPLQDREKILANFPNVQSAIEIVYNNEFTPHTNWTHGPKSA